MRHRKLAMLLAALLALAGCAGAGEAMIDITLDKPQQDTATATMEGDDRVVIDVTSGTGIGGLAATRVGDEWPAETIVVRLRLSGLERLEIGYGNVTIETGVSSTGEPGPPLMLTVTDEQGQAQSASPSSDVYYPDIRRVTLDAAGGAPATAFEVALPSHFHHGDYDSFHMQWIDFYR